jgi:hypothetical protein
VFYPHIEIATVDLKIATVGVKKGLFLPPLIFFAIYKKLILSFNKFIIP